MRDGIRCSTYCGDEHCICDAKPRGTLLGMGDFVPREEPPTSSIFTSQELDITQKHLEIVRDIFTKQSLEGIVIDKAIKVIHYFRSNSPLVKIALHNEWADLNKYIISESPLDLHSNKQEELDMDSPFDKLLEPGPLIKMHLLDELYSTHIGEGQHNTLYPHPVDGERLPFVDQSDPTDNLFFEKAPPIPAESVVFDYREIRTRSDRISIGENQPKSWFQKLKKLLW